MALAAKDLPLKRELMSVSRPKRGAALAVRAKALLYAASPVSYTHLYLLICTTVIRIATKTAGWYWDLMVINLNWLIIILLPVVCIWQHLVF